MNTNSAPEKFIQAKHRVVRLTPLLAAAAGGLALTLAALWMMHPSAAPVPRWGPMGWLWLGGLAATTIAAAAAWRMRQRSVVRTAAEADALFATHNRLETAAALQSSGDALARAQRAETERFLERKRLPLQRGWLVLLSTVTTLLLAAHIATLVLWTRPTHATPAAVVKKDAAAPLSMAKKETPPKDPPASIEWVSPESETSATAIEEVPLEARADSETGLRNAVLELEVNGEHRLSQPLTDDLTSPGIHAVKASIYLDQMEVKTYDIVSYHVSADRIAATKLSPTSSQVQFVQVKPARDDTFICAGGDQPSKCFNYVRALKAAQLRLMKDNFTLAHAGVSHAQDEWRDENSRVGSEQSQLAERTDEVITLMATNNYPAPIMALVRDSKPLMADAGGQIKQEQNQPALAPQGKALGYLTEVEKYLKNSIKLAGENRQPNANDPFQRPKHLDLKTHPLTRAGTIDALANEQSRLAGDLASGNTNATLAGEAGAGDGQAINGTPGQRQSAIKQRINDFLNDPAILAEALTHLQSSDDLAEKSLEQIDNQDFVAAGEPAAAAARELHQTAAALRAGGNDTAKNKLADALLKLSAAAGQARQAAKANTDAEAAAAMKQIEDSVKDAAKQLASEAQRQEDNGATNAAARLGGMANLLQNDALKQMLAQAQQSPRDAGHAEALAKKLEELADRAGQQRNSGPPSRQEVARMVEQLQRTQANLQRLASQAQTPGSAQGGKSSRSPSPAPGRSSSPTPGQSSSPSPGQSQSSSPGQSTALAHGTSQSASGPASPNPEPGHARTPEMSRSEMQRAEAAQLLDDLRVTGADLRLTQLDTVQLDNLEEILRQAANHPVAEPADIVPVAMQLDPPLKGIIRSLQTQLAGMRRPFELASKETAATPPAYRAAVADYFEQLSRDYRAAGSPLLKTNDSH